MHSSALFCEDRRIKSHALDHGPTSKFGVARLKYLFWKLWSSWPVAFLPRCGPFSRADIQMGFLEKAFGFSYDHGDDRSLDVLLLIALVAMITVLARQFFHHLRD